MDIIASDRQAQLAPWPMYRALVGVALVCGLLIVGAFIATFDIIAANRAAALQRAILQVLPGAHSYRALDWEQTHYAGFDEEGSLVGIAVETRNMGYQDVIVILYGYDPQRQLIVGMQVLESKETPGLGDKIEKDANFLSNFDALDVRLDRAGQSLAHPLALVKPGQKTEAWQIDGIAGATISSAAIARMLADSTARWLPRLHREQAGFTPPEETVDAP